MFSCCLHSTRLLIAVWEFQVSLPLNPPDAESDDALTKETQVAVIRNLLCPGCSDQDVVLNRCHGCIIVNKLSQRYPQRESPVPRGLLGVYPASRIVELLDDEQSVFIGRKAPRGVPTKSVGAQPTMHRSRYSNPFIITKKGFTLGESLQLFERYTALDYRVLTPQEMQDAIDEAPYMPETIEEMVAKHPQLFD